MEMFLATVASLVIAVMAVGLSLLLNRRSKAGCPFCGAQGVLHIDSRSSFCSACEREFLR